MVYTVSIDRAQNTKVIDLGSHVNQDNVHGHSLYNIINEVLFTPFEVCRGS